MSKIFIWWITFLPKIFDSKFVREEIFVKCAHAEISSDKINWSDRTRQQKAGFDTDASVGFRSNRREHRMYEFNHLNLVSGIYNTKNAERFGFYVIVDVYMFHPLRCKYLAHKSSHASSGLLKLPVWFVLSKLKGSLHCIEMLPRGEMYSVLNPRRTRDFLRTGVTKKHDSWAPQPNCVGPIVLGPIFLETPSCG